MRMLKNRVRMTSDKLRILLPEWVRTRRRERIMSSVVQMARIRVMREYAPEIMGERRFLQSQLTSQFMPSNRSTYKVSLSIVQ